MGNFMYVSFYRNSTIPLEFSLYNMYHYLDHLILVIVRIASIDETTCMLQKNVTQQQNKIIVNTCFVFSWFISRMILFSNSNKNF